MSIAAIPTRPSTPPERNDAAPPSKTQGVQRSRFTLWGNDGFTIGDLIDVVNPLQHIPVVGTLYRAFSGDSIAAAPRLLGGALFGGVIGLATAAANAVIAQVTGKDVGDHVLTHLHLLPPSGDEAVATARVSRPTSPPPASFPPPQAALVSAPFHTRLGKREDTSPTPQEALRIGLLERATRQFRLIAALGTYAQRSQLLAATPTGERVNTHF